MRMYRRIVLCTEDVEKAMIVALIRYQIPPESSSPYSRSRGQIRERFLDKLVYQETGRDSGGGRALLDQTLSNSGSSRIVVSVV